MGYGSQHFATGAEFDEWIEGTKIATRKCDVILTCTISSVGETISFDSTEMTGIDWGDGTVTKSASHTYEKAGVYDIRMFGVKTFVSLPKDLLVNSAFFGSGVTKIGDDAFRSCVNLSSATIESAEVGFHAFASCVNLKSVTLGNGVKKLYGHAFHGCKSLESIVIPNSVTHMGDYVFAGCTSLESIVIPDSVTKFYAQVFDGCTNLKSATLGNGIDEVPFLTFRDCSSLATVTLGSGIKQIEEQSFQGVANPCVITINSTEKVSLYTINYDDVFSSGCKVIVPYEKLSEYKADVKWAAEVAAGRVIIDAYALVSETKGVSGEFTLPYEEFAGTQYGIMCFFNFAEKGLRNNDAIFFVHSTMEDKLLADDANIFISADGTNVTFYCETKPTQDINFKYFICRG